MSEHGGVLPGLWPIHGDGVLARQGDLVLLVHPAGGPFTDRLLDLLANAARAGENGRRFADLISAEYESDAAAAPAAGDEEGPAAVAFGLVNGGTAVAVYGTAWAEVTTARGVQLLSAGEPYGRMLCVLPSTLVKVRAGVQPAENVGDTDPYLRLADGVVRAVALVYAPAEVPPRTDRPAAPVASPIPAAPPPDSARLSGGAAPVSVPAPAQASQAGASQPGAGQAEAGQPEPGQPEADQAEAGQPEASQVEADQAEPAVVPGPVGYDVAEPAPVPPPGPYLADSGAGDEWAEHRPTSLDAGWRDQAPPPGPAPVDAGFADPGAHMPTSLDVAWRDQAPPGPTPLDGGFGEPGAPFGGGQPVAAGQFGQPQYDWDAVQGGQGVPASDFGQDFLSMPFLGGQAPDDMPQRDPLPLGAEPLDERGLGIAEGPAPLVLGIYCKNGDFNDPEARYCAVCGIGMAQLTKIPQEGPRPPLGVLILDDGSVCQLDADYVMGREPTLDKSVADGHARPLRLGGASDLVSRIHARVELDGWQVFVCDLNSANGTNLVLPGETTGTRLPPGVRTPLVAGAQIRLGDAYALRYDSHRHR